jgi:hypothetical protein
MTNTVTVMASLPELRDDNNVAHASTRVVVRELYLPWVVR